VIKSRNADVEAVAVSAVEGKPTYGGDMLVKPLISGDEMMFLEIHYAAGVGAPLHTHTHESIAYVVKGKMKSTVGSEEFIMGPGDVCRHPEGVLHGLEGSVANQRLGRPRCMISGDGFGGTAGDDRVQG